MILYNDLSEVNTITFEIFNDVYLDNLSIRNSLVWESYKSAELNCALCLSPFHTPDQKNKKGHTHGLLYESHHNLSYKKVDKFLTALYKSTGGKYPAPLVVQGGKYGRRKLLRYFIHLEQPLKEQFDLRDPMIDDVDISEDDGRAKDSQLTSAYSEKFGIFSSPDFDYWATIKLTEREKSARNAELKDVMLPAVFDFIRTNGIRSYTDVVDWSLSIGCFQTVSKYAYVLQSYIKGLDTAKNSYKDDDDNE